MGFHHAVKIGQNLHCYLWTGQGNNCNTTLLSHVLRGERPHMLVDPGHDRNELGEPCFDSLAQAIAKDGFQMEDIGLVVCTHSHPDHFEAVDALVDRGALLALSHEEYEFLQGQGKMFYSVFSAHLPRAKPYFYLNEGQLDLGSGNKLNIEVLLTPGHSPGSICLYLEDEKILISGDVIFSSSVGRTDFPGGDTSQLRQSIERLSQLDLEYIVPGHNTEAGNIIFGKDDIEENFRMVKLFFSHG